MHVAETRNRYFASISAVFLFFRMNSSFLQRGVSMRFGEHVGFDQSNDLCYFLGIRVEKDSSVLVDVCSR